MQKDVHFRILLLKIRLRFWLNNSMYMHLKENLIRPNQRAGQWRKKPIANEGF